MAAPERQRGGRAARSHLIAALVYAGAFGLLFLVAVRTTIGQQIDAASLGGFEWLRRDAWLWLYGFRSELTVLLLVAALAAVVIGAVRHRFIDGVAAAGVVAILVVVLPVLDGVLVRPFLGDFAYVLNTFPSGHLAYSMAGAVAVQRLWGDRLGDRGFVALTLLPWFVGWASLMSFAHRASDMIGAVLLVGAVAELIGAWRPPRPWRSSLVPRLLRVRTHPIRLRVAVLGAAAAVLATALALPHVLGAEVLVLGYGLVLMWLIALVLSAGARTIGQSAGDSSAVERI